ncbi:unnamed protein product, partial [Didymodactylos carnosus]
QIIISNDIADSLIGGNKATEAEEEDAGVDASHVSGINVVLNHKLVETSFQKETFKEWIREYSKKLKEHLQENSPNRVQPFKAGMTKVAQEILTKFAEYRFYLGESMNTDGMVILQYYKVDGLTPYFLYFKDGLNEIKYVSIDYYRVF